MEKKLYRSMNNRAILGICGGLGEYLDIDPILVRLLTVIFTLLGGSGILFYIIAIFIIPENPKYKAIKEGSYQETVYEYSYSTEGSQENGQSGEVHYDYEVGPDGEVKEAAGEASKRTTKDLSDYARERKKSSSESGALILGLSLIALGAFVLLKMFLPWIDTRLFWALGLIVAGIVIIAKR